MNALPPPGLVALGALESDTGVQDVSGAESGSHRFIENHGATESSKKCVMSFPGWLTVGSCAGSRPRRSTYVTSAADPGAFEM